jgi:hypothetical protein
MRPLTPAQAAATAAPRANLAMLVELDLLPEPMRLWSGIGEFVWGNGTFTGAGTLLGVSDAAESAEVRANGATLSLSGVPPEVIDAALDTTWQGRGARVWVALLDDAAALISEPVQVLSARMDALAWQEGEDATVSLSVESRLIDLERARVRRYTSADQQRRHPGDRAFEYVESLVEREITWGRR